MIGEGQQAPDFTLPDQDGNNVTLSDLRGRTVVLYVYPTADTPVLEGVGPSYAGAVTFSPQRRAAVAIRAS